MSQLSELEELRLRNLKLLHGTTSEHIAPTSGTLLDALNAAGISMSQATLSNLYLRKKSIDASLAERIEAALGVSPGWLSSDHTAWLNASSQDRDLISMVLSLQPEAKQHLAALLRHFTSFK
jgi:transcriptional regulator with XRE-family HTH domain